MTINIFIPCLLSLLALTCGCVSTAPSKVKNTSIYSVGDRAGVTYDEVVASVPFPQGQTSYQNLHVALSAVVNVKRTTYSSTYEVEDILRRLEPRIAAQITETLLTTTATDLSNRAAALQTITTVAQRIVDSAMSQWEHGSDYRVEILVTNLYWTDPSVGRPQKQNRWGW